MPAHSIGDDVALISRVLAGMHQQGLARQLRQSASLDVNVVAKACGTDPATVRSWEDGTAAPGAHQGLVWLSAIHEAAGWRARPGEAASDV